jgi:hypothetical protein
MANRNGALLIEDQIMPHSTPPSKQFEAIRNAFPAVFDCASCNARQLAAGETAQGIASSQWHETRYFCARCKFDHATAADRSP